MSRPVHNDRRAIVFALITVLFWSTVATAFKIGLRELDPIQLIFIATLVTVFLLFFIVIFSGKLSLIRQITTRQLLFHAMLGLLNPFIYYIILFKAYSLLPAQVAQPINMIWPIVLVVLSVIFLKQKIGWRSWVALAISFASVVLISSQGDLSNLREIDFKGVVLCLVSSLIWSSYWIINSKSTVTDQLIGLLLNFSFGLIYLTLGILLFSSFHFPFSSSLIAGVYIGVFEIGISFVFWMKALALASNSAKIANLIYLSPFLSLLFIHFILGESIYMTTILGLFFIISGILFQQTRKPIPDETK